MKSENFPPLEGKTWEIACRELSDPADQIGLLGELAAHMGPDNLHNFPAYDYRLCPAPTPAVSAVMKLLKQDETSTSSEIAQAAHWALAAYQEAVTADELAWATAVLTAIWGKEQREVRGAPVLAKEARKLNEAMRAFERSTSEACGYATATMAAAVARYYGPDYVLDTVWSQQVDAMAKAECDLYAAKQKGAA